MGEYVLVSAVTLEEPLLEEDEATASLLQHDNAAPSPSSSELVPRSINRVDWEALLQAFVDTCRQGWSNILGKDPVV